MEKESSVKPVVVVRSWPKTSISLLTMAVLLTATLSIFGQSKVDATNLISVTAKVGAPLPQQEAQITSLVNGQTLGAEKTTVEGTCQPKMYISIISNDLIRGGTMCSEDGRFLLDIDLASGSNTLVAQTNDGIDQSGPLSAPIVVNKLDQSTVDLSVAVDKAYKRIGLDDTLSWDLKILGGGSIHAIGVDWGDGTSDLFPSTEKFMTLSHKYDSPGVRAIKVKVSDESGSTSQLNLVASISSLANLDQNALAGAVGYLSRTTLYITVLLMGASFIIGNYYKGGKKYVWIKERQDTIEVS